MKNPWLNRCAFLLALSVLLAVVTGGWLTSVSSPLPGAPAAVPAMAAPLARIHSSLAGAAAVLALFLALTAPASVRLPAWIAAGLVAAETALGIYPVAGILHALLAPLLFSTAVAIALFTSNSWQAPARAARNLSPPLRKLSIWVPVLLVAQIALGAGFRHNAMGVVWHILNAMIVLGTILVLGIGVLRMYAGHPALRRAALTLLIIAGIQVLLGFAVYITLLIVSENNTALIALGTIHVATGSLTLAAAIVLTLQLRRSAPAIDSQKGDR